MIFFNLFCFFYKSQVDHALKLNNLDQGLSLL